MVRARLVKENQTDRAAKGNVYEKLPMDGPKAELVSKYCEYVQVRMQTRLPKSSIITKIKERITVHGYSSGELKSHVYDDVPHILDLWRMKMMIKLYSFAIGDAEGQK